MRTLIVVLLAAGAITWSSAQAEDKAQSQLAKQIHNAIKDAATHDHFQVDAPTLATWLKEKRTDFQVLDVRMGEGIEEQFKKAHIPGAILIPYVELFKPGNLRKLDKRKKIVLVCHMGATEELVVVPLRMLGYDARALVMGMAAWEKDYPMQGFVKDSMQRANESCFPLEKSKTPTVNQDKK